MTVSERPPEHRALVKRIRRRAFQYGLRLTYAIGGDRPADRSWFVVDRDGELISPPTGVTLAEADGLIPRQRALRSDARVREFS